MDLKTRLYWWNIAVTAVHWTSFTAILIISLTRLDTVTRVKMWFDDNLGTTIPTSLGSYELFATLVPFPFITGVFHLLAAYNVDNYYENVLRVGVNRMRWIEYAITNSLMTWSLCFLAGAGSIMIPIICVLLNVTMQSYGWFHEMRNHRVKQQYRSLTPLLIGFVPWAGIWAVVFTYYGANMSTMTLSDGFAIIGTFVWSLTFVLPLLWRYYKGNTTSANYNMEVAYIVLSLTAKLWLDWTVVVGNLVGN